MKAQSSNHNIAFTLSEKCLFKLAEQALFEQSLVEGVSYPLFTHPPLACLRSPVKREKMMLVG